MGSKKSPIWLWPNTLSLDAPLVAVAWVWMLKQSRGVRYVEESAIWILFGAVWSIYVMDRIIDVWSGKRDKDETIRHAFSWKYRYVLIPMVIGVASYSIYYCLYYLPATVLSAGIAALLTSCIYLACIPFQSKKAIPYSKNLWAGIIFAFGVAIPARLYEMNSPTIINDVFHPLIDTEKSFVTGIKDAVFNLVRMVVDHIVHLMGTLETITFGMLCMLNITAIDLWERSRRADDMEEKATYEMILTMGILGLAGFCLVYSTYTVEYSKPYFYSIMAACGILHVINRVRTHFTLDAQRVLADIAILIPIPFYFLFKS